MPAFPARSEMPVMVTVITLIASSVLAVGVKVAVQMVPAPPSVTVLNIPPSIVVTSVLVNVPATDSLKVKVTSDVSPILRAVSANIILVRVGTAVSITIERLPEAIEVFPAVSTCFAFIVACVPLVNVVAVIVTVEATHVPEPFDVALSYKVTIAPVSQEIVKSGVLSDVLLSVLEEPRSVAEVISGIPGADGVAVSITIERFPDATEIFPAISVCFAFIVAWVPSVKVVEVMVTVDAEQVPEPFDVTLSYRVTVDPVSQEMVKSGVLSDVLLSVDTPESVAEVMSGVPGAAGVEVSILIERFPDATEPSCFALIEA